MSCSSQPPAGEQPEIRRNAPGHHRKKAVIRRSVVGIERRIRPGHQPGKRHQVRPGGEPQPGNAIRVDPQPPGFIAHPSQRHLHIMQLGRKAILGRKAVIDIDRHEPAISQPPRNARHVLPTAPLPPAAVNHQHRRPGSRIVIGTIAVGNIDIGIQRLRPIRRREALIGQHDMALLRQRHVTPRVIEMTRTAS